MYQIMSQEKLKIILASVLEHNIVNNYTSKKNFFKGSLYWGQGTGHAGREGDVRKLYFMISEIGLKN